MNYKQQSSQGCLVVALLYLFGVKPTKAKEKQILSDGLFGLRENYTLGCLRAFLDLYPDKAATLYVDNHYFLNILELWVKHPRITMVYKQNDQLLLNSLVPPYIVYTDNHITDGWTHLPHFMLVTSETDKLYNVFDPPDFLTFP